MPVGALAVENGDKLFFKGNVLSTDGREKVEIELEFEKNEAYSAGHTAAKELLANGASGIVDKIRNSR
jgi:hydroxymethylbilane synthase